MIIINKCCSVCGKHEVHKFGMCIKHYKQVSIYGVPLDSNQRTTSDMNEIVFDENNKDIAYIILYNRLSDEITRAKIDSKNIYLVENRKWRVSKKKRKIYVVSGNVGDKGQVYLHHLIFYKDDKIKNDMYEIDHIDSDSLNNTEENLREADRFQNCQNSAKRTDNVSGFRGVSSLKNGNFRPEIQSRKIVYRFKECSDINEAVFIRLIAEKILHGKFSSSNITVDDIDISILKKKELEKYTIEQINKKQSGEVILLNLIN